MSRYRQPVARWDFSTPCPRCHSRIIRGDQVTKVDLPGQTKWWHQSCRDEVLAVLREEYSRD